MTPSYRQSMQAQSDRLHNYMPAEGRTCWRAHPRSNTCSTRYRDPPGLSTLDIRQKELTTKLAE
jgi:hypothetical protein